MITLFTEDGLFQRALGHFRVAFANFQTLSICRMSGFGALCPCAVSAEYLFSLSCCRRSTTRSRPTKRMPRARSPVKPVPRAGPVGFVLGLPSGVAGQFGRKAAGPSSGGSLRFPAQPFPAVLIPAGSTAKDSTGAVTIKTRANVTTDGPPNLQTVSLVSVTTGAQANFAAGSVFTWTPAIAGLTSTFTLNPGTRERNRPRIRR